MNQKAKAFCFPSILPPAFTQHNLCEITKGFFFSVCLPATIVSFAWTFAKIQAEFHQHSNNKKKWTIHDTLWIYGFCNKMVFLSDIYERVRVLSSIQWTFLCVIMDFANTKQIIDPLKFVILILWLLFIPCITTSTLNAPTNNQCKLKDT